MTNIYGRGGNHRCLKFYLISSSIIVGIIRIFENIWAYFNVITDVILLHSSLGWAGSLLSIGVDRFDLPV